MVEIDDAALLKLSPIAREYQIPLPAPRIEDLAGLSLTLLMRAGLLDAARSVIRDIVEHLSPVDWILFVEEKWYREHLFHQVRTALLADVLLEFGVVDLERLPEGLDKETLRAVLFSAALLHDHGFALSRLARIVPAMFSSGIESLGAHGREMFRLLCRCYEGTFAQSLIRGFCTPPERPERSDKLRCRLDREVREAVAEYLGDRRIGLDARVVDKLSNPIVQGEPDHRGLYDHGLWSALNLAVRFSEAGVPWHDRPDAVPLARVLVEAVAIHNRQDFCKDDFDVEHNPIAGVMALADELHEWSRRAVPDNDPVDIRCQLEISRAKQGTKQEEMEIHFIYSEEDLREARWPVEDVREWKQSCLKRLEGASGLPGSMDVRVDARQFDQESDEAVAPPTGHQ